MGARYNIGGLFGAAVDFKPRNWAAFDRSDYFCSQLVAAAYSSAGAALHLSLEQTPGNLADMVNRFNLPANFSPRLTSLGALFDQGYHQSVRDGKECINLDLTEREQQYLVNVISTRLNRNGGTSVQLHRLTVDSTCTVLAHFTVTREGVGNFEVTYSISGNTDANINIVAPKNSRDIGADVESGMRLARRHLQQKYFAAPATPVVAAQSAGQVGPVQTWLAQASSQAPVSDARHFAAVDAVFAANV